MRGEALYSKEPCRGGGRISIYALSTYIYIYWTIYNIPIDLSTIYIVALAANAARLRPAEQTCMAQGGFRVTRPTPGRYIYALHTSYISTCPGVSYVRYRRIHTYIHTYIHTVIRSYTQSSTCPPPPGLPFLGYIIDVGLYIYILYSTPYR